MLFGTADLANARKKLGECWRYNSSKIKRLGKLQPVTALVPSGTVEGDKGKQPGAAIDIVGEGVYEGFSTRRISNTSTLFWTARIIKHDQDERPGPRNLAWERFSQLWG